MSRKNTPGFKIEFNKKMYAIADFVLSGSPFFKESKNKSDPKSEYNIFMRGMKFGIEHIGEEIFLHNYGHDVLFFIGNEENILKRVKEALNFEEVQFVMTG